MCLPQGQQRGASRLPPVWSGFAALLGAGAGAGACFAAGGGREAAERRRLLLPCLLCAVGFPAILQVHGLSVATLRFWLLLWLLVLLALTDMRTGLIPDRWLLAGVGLFALSAPFMEGEPLAGLLGGVTVSVPLLLLVLLADKISGKETMGGGDVKLLFVTGLFFGWQLGLLHLMLACAVGIVLAPIWKQGGKNVPFAPAICLAGLGAMLWGERMLEWYLSLFGL